MGRPKSRLTLEGVSFIDSAAVALSAVADEGIQVVGGADAGSRGLFIVPDIEPGNGGDRSGGAIIGLRTALMSATSEWIAVLACDMPFVTKQVFGALAAIDRANADAVVPVDPDGEPQPLCAFYRIQTCLPVTAHLLLGTDRSLRSLLAVINTLYVRPEELSHLGDLSAVFTNVNTPTDYRRAARRGHQK